MTKLPRVSVIVPVYNVGNLLPRCIDSILAQTYTDFELILVNDGSTDKSAEVVNRYALQDSRIVSIDQDNAGLSMARNAGIDCSRGEILTFIDSDDWVADRFLENLLQPMLHDGAEISVGSFLRCYPDGLPPEVSDKAEPCVTVVTNYQALAELYGPNTTQMTVAWGKLYSRKVVGKIRFPAGRIHEDVYTTYKFLHSANRVAISTEPLYFYWQRPNSIMGSGTSRKSLIDATEGFLDRVAFMLIMGLAEQSAMALRKAVGRYSALIRTDRSRGKGPWNDEEIARLRRAIRASLRNVPLSKSERMHLAAHVIFPVTMHSLTRLIRRHDRKGLEGYDGR